MCRIAGILSDALPAELIREKTALMCRAQQNGGPDDEGVYLSTDGRTGLGHRRLSIIDLSRNGHQPMSDDQERLVITFNGEIYNYLELKARLIPLGARFRSATDTEVILQAYLHWGTASFAELRGMFAFALYDRMQGKTYLVRDQMGIKPLYYHVQGGQLSFASEIRAFKAAGLATEEEQDWRIRFLAFGHVPEPGTTLKDVLALPKGTYLCWDHANRRYTMSRYMQAIAKPEIMSVSEAQAAVRTALTGAVSRQLIADAPIGVLLSGGIDSSILTMLAGQEQHDQLKTVSLYFKEQDHDESIFQQEIQRNFRGESFTHLVQRSDLEEHLPDIMSAMDMPTTDGINSWFISRHSRQDGLKAVLSGIGADELFGGYPSFERIRALDRLRLLPANILNAAVGILPDRFKRIGYLKYQHPLADYLFMRGLFSLREIGALLGLKEQQIAEALFSGSAPSYPVSDPLSRASWLETELYMQNQLLRDTDVMSMHHGLEVRVPFLDEQLRQAVDKISPVIRFARKPVKKLLVDTFVDLLPRAVWDRPKMGFSFPLQQWLSKHPAFNTNMACPNKAARDMLQGFQNGQVHWSKAFALYQIKNEL